jgi:uncharacterized DUF497 family protein
MTKIKISQLIWDEWNTEHIKKHKIVKYGRILLIGRINKRILSIIVAQEEKNTYYVVTARDAAKKERVQFYEKENK